MEKIDTGDASLKNPNTQAIAFYETGEGREFLTLASFYARSVVVPPLLADRLRARGELHATARDFECGCFTDPETDRPLCLKLRPRCRFASKGAEEPADLEQFAKRSPSFRLTLIHGALVCIAYAGAAPRERRKMKAIARRARSRYLRKYFPGVAAGCPAGEIPVPLTPVRAAPHASSS